MSSTDIPARSASPVPRVAIGAVAAAILCIAVNTGVAALAKSWTGHGSQTGLMLIAYGPLTAIGVIAGTAGWASVRHYAAQPRAVLRVLVPAVVVVSLVPGVVLLFLGNGIGNVVGLWIMHIVVAVVTVAVLSRVLPLPDNAV